MENQVQTSRRAEEPTGRVLEGEAMGTRRDAAQAQVSHTAGPKDSQPLLTLEMTPWRKANSKGQSTGW